jgi:hypothetical protein
VQRFLVAIVLAGCHATPAAPTMPPFGEPQRNACGGVRDLGVMEVTVERESGDSDSTVRFDSWHRGQVHVDGEAKGVLYEGTPTTIVVSAGSHLFAVEAEGFRRWEDRVEIQPDTRVTFHVR